MSASGCRVSGERHYFAKCRVRGDDSRLARCPANEDAISIVIMCSEKALSPDQAWLLNFSAMHHYTTLDMASTASRWFGYNEVRAVYEDAVMR